VKPITEQRAVLPTRISWLLRCSRYLLFAVGVLALGYVALTLLEARSYQAQANRFLDSQIQMQPVHQISEAKPAITLGDVLGRLEIPRLGMSVAVLHGTNSRILRLGAGHIEGTALPGEKGNSAIAGHRDTFFRTLKGIRENDEIHLQTATGLFRYEVDWMKVVAPDDTSVLAPSSESALTLVTCYPFYFLGAAPQRFVVHAHALAGTALSDHP